MRRRALIPTTPLLVTGAFGPALSAPAVGTAIARGLQTGGLAPADLCPIGPEHEHGADDVRAFLDAHDFDARMRRARAVIVAAGRLREQTLTGSAVFEIATRARQSGVPAYAVTGENRLDAFDARMLDLQLIIEADGARALAAAGRKLARLLQPQASARASSCANRVASATVE
ncbi:MAG: glycerate kinase [Solirubrobacteraceae bacterium]